MDDQVKDKIRELYWSWVEDQRKNPEHFLKALGARFVHSFNARKGFANIHLHPHQAMDPHAEVICLEVPENRAAKMIALGWTPDFIDFT